MSNQLYPSDLTDREWEYIKPLIPAAKTGGRDRKTDMRQTLNAIFYVARTGCPWRALDMNIVPISYGFYESIKRCRTPIYCVVNPCLFLAG
jgi:transposase